MSRRIGQSGYGGRLDVNDASHQDHPFDAERMTGAIYDRRIQPYDVRLTAGHPQCGLPGHTASM